MIVQKSELENFKNEILAKGLDPSDFELKEVEEPIQGINVQPIVGQVIVRRKSNAIKRTYKAGHMSHWVADFVFDLRKGVFN